MFTNIAPKRFFISLALISVFVLWTLTNLDFASQLFAKTQDTISSSLGWMVILAANGFLLFVI